MKLLWGPFVFHNTLLGYELTFPCGKHFLIPFVISETNVVFSILNGESLDYIGSSRLVYDLKENQFHGLGEQNLTLDHISGVVELGQFRRNEKQQIYLHASNYDKFEIVSRLASNLSAKILPGSVPPASIQRFLKEKSHMPVVVIASHGGKFDNNFYESMLDDAKRVGYQRYV